MLDNELAWLIRRCQSTSAGVFPVIHTNQHGTNIRGQLCSDTSCRDVYIRPPEQDEQIKLLLFLFVFLGLFSKASLCSIVAICLDTLLLVSMLWQCIVVWCLPFCWITLWSGNWIEPQIITAVEMLEWRHIFLCFLCQLFAAFFLRHFVFPPDVFTLFLCASLRSLCS